MAVFEWRGLNPAGREVKGVRDADNQRVLRALLKKDGILLTSALEESAAQKANARNIDLGKYFRRVSVLDLAMMTRQFATLLKSGVPLVESMSVGYRALSFSAEQQDSEGGAASAASQMLHAFVLAMATGVDGGDTPSLARPAKGESAVVQEMLAGRISAAEAVDCLMGRQARAQQEQQQAGQALADPGGQPDQGPAAGPAASRSAVPPVHRLSPGPENSHRPSRLNSRASAQACSIRGSTKPDTTETDV